MIQLGSRPHDPLPGTPAVPAATIPKPRMPDPAEYLEQMHAIEWAQGWQYATVWRPADEPWPEDEQLPPAGSGWERNTHYRDGYEKKVRTQVTYWLRRAPGMVPWQREAHLSIRDRQD